MFFISWGSRGKVVEIGPAGQRHCGICGKDADFTDMVAYTVRHVYWIFRWSTDRTPYMLCGNCGGAHHSELNPHKSTEVHQAIPLWDRRGWLAGVGGIAALVGTASLATASDASSDKTYVAAPQVGDRYEVDLARMLDKPEAPHMYSVLRVTRIGGSEVEMAMAKNYYTDMRGVNRDMRQGDTHSEAYYTPEHLVLPRASVAKMYADGVIYEVVR